LDRKTMYRKFNIQELYGKLRKELRKYPKIIMAELFVGLGMLAALLILSFLGEFIIPYNPLSLSNDLLVPPNLAHIMGTDNLGRDIASRVFAGAQISLTVAIIATAISVAIGTPLGVLSGYIGGKTDKILTLVADTFWGFPVIVLAMLVAWLMGPNAINTAFAVGIAVSPSFFRIVRSETLSIKEMVFVEAEKALGASSKRIAFLHILPNTLPSVFVLVTLRVGRSIIAVAGLGFLGLGVPPPTPELGTDLGVAREFLISGAWWLVVFPTLTIFLLTVCFNLISEGLGAIWKPKMKTV